MQKQTITIPKAKIEKYNKYLASGEAYSDLRYGTIESWTARFAGGVEADIKVCAADDCSLFVDAVLFHRGSEACLLDVSYELNGEYEFEHKGEKYIVEVVAG